MPSKYEKLAGNQDEGNGRIWNRYGFTELEWSKLTTEERELHYNRQKICEHHYVYPGVAGTLTDERLRDSYSRDPYFHTAHMEPCQRPALSIDECPCQMCANKIGIPRD